MTESAYKALADATRRRILKLLGEKPMTAGEIAEKFQLAKSTLSGHFAVLKAADLIQEERRGATIVYSLNLSVVEETLAAPEPRTLLEPLMWSVPALTVVPPL